MSLRDQMKADMLYHILNNDEFSENVVFTPYGLAAKTIKAVVIRDRLDPGSQDSGRTLRKQAEVYLANDSTYGIASVNKGQDTIQMPIYEGGATAVLWSVIEIISVDSGAWRLLVQR